MNTYSHPHTPKTYRPMASMVTLDYEDADGVWSITADPMGPEYVAALYESYQADRESGKYDRTRTAAYPATESTTDLSYSDPMMHYAASAERILERMEERYYRTNADMDW